ncbi:MAG: flagellar motor stator protein MotA [Thermoguttaceae bacterium]|jgi:chemotaxis protein MotA
MLVIAGFIVVLGAVLGGFAMAGGQVLSLIHPSEFLTIGGAAIGALIVMSPKKVLVDLIRGVLQCVKGTPYNKGSYEDLFKMLYGLFRTARRDGLMALESHILDPHKSSIFGKYPKLVNNHHAMTFLTGALTPLVDGTVKPEKLPSLLEADLKIIEEEHHAPMGVLTKTADALPGFGIVAAVLGIVITMSSINGPVDEIGEKVGAALVGTFLGILLSYGFFAPMAVRMEFLGAAEIGFLRIIATAIPGFVGDLSPKVVLEQARRGVVTEFRPSREEMDDWLREVEASGP